MQSDVRKSKPRHNQIIFQTKGIFEGDCSVFMVMFGQIDSSYTNVHSYTYIYYFQPHICTFLIDVNKSRAVTLSSGHCLLCTCGSRPTLFLKKEHLRDFISLKTVFFFVFSCNANFFVLFLGCHLAVFKGGGVSRASVAALMQLLYTA